MIPKEELYSLRTNYYTPQEILDAFSITVSAYTKYVNGKYVLDVSSYQDKVDFKTIRAKAPWIVGCYCKLGEVGDKGYGTEDGWKDPTFSQRIQDLADNHMWAGAYIFVNTAWFGPQNGIDLGDYRSWDDISDETTKFIKLIQNDPHVRLLLRQLKIGFEALGSIYNFDAEKVKKVKALATKRVHAIVLDVERYWKWYPISTGGTPEGRVADIWIGEVTERTGMRYQWLIDHGFLPKEMQLLLYSADWVMSNYSETLRMKSDLFDTACAGYYYAAGYVQTTWDEVKNKYLAAIPDSWRPRLFGGSPTYGKKVWLFQILADRFACAEIQNNMGAWSPFDLNYINGTMEQFVAKYSLWTDYAQMETPPVDPPPDPDPNPDPTKTYATVTTSKLNVRKAAGTSNSLIDQFLLNGATKEVLEERILPNGEKWARINIEGWICEGQNGVPYVKIEQK